MLCCLRDHHIPTAEVADTSETDVSIISEMMESDCKSDVSIISKP